jgi:endonuclease-3
MEERLKLPGVGRKPANIILCAVYKKPAVVTDTHCIRLANRMGLANSKDPYKVELSLRELIPEDKQTDFCHRLVLHGRKYCTARKPDCEHCPLRGRVY